MSRSLPFLVALLVVAAGGGVVLASVQTAGPYSLTFTSKGGNEWWVEVTLSGPSASQVSKVDAMDTGGAWTALTLRSWGAWAASFHVEPGHTVRFRATFPDGTQIESCDWQHPTPVEQCGSAPPPPPPSGNLSATFSKASGNEWWVQVHVTAGETLKGVDARVNDGAWQPLQLKSWGDWAASIHAPEGSLVQFRATGSSGAQALSGHYRWTEATPVDGGPSPTPPPSSFSATFRPKAGNEWWVETTVNANQPLAKVQARVEGTNDSWHDLTFRSWGAWAGSIHAPNGSLVRFRAESTTREDAVSGLYRWTSATPVPDAEGGVWPVNGSYVKYAYDGGSGSPGGDYWAWTELNVTLSYQSGRWEALCEGWDYVYSQYPEEHTNATRVLRAAAFGPPTGPRDAGVGATVSVDALSGCSAHWDWGEMTVENATDVNATQRGRPVAAPAFVGQYDPDCHCMGSSAAWSMRTGLTLDWWSGGMSHGESGSLVDTDAPLTASDRAMISPPHAGWPYEGSFARYANVEWGNYTGYEYLDFRNVTFVYHGGVWSASCDESFHSASSGDSTFHDTLDREAPYAPLRVATGQHAQATLATWCYTSASEDLVVQGQFPEDATREGATMRARVWWADEAQPPDQDAWWDTATGLVLRYEWTSSDGTVRTLGHLTDTDAPLAPYQG